MRCLRTFRVSETRSSCRERGIDKILTRAWTSCSMFVWPLRRSIPGGLSIFSLIRQVGGPIWADAIHDAAYVEDVMRIFNERKESFASHKRVFGLLSSIREVAAQWSHQCQQELHSAPLFYDLSALCNVVNCTCPPLGLAKLRSLCDIRWEYRAALMSKGFRVTPSHTTPTALKTDAPLGLIFDFLRAWVKKHPVKPSSASSPSTIILSKPPS